MRVLFVIGTVGHGGHTRSAIALGRALLARGVEVHVAAGNGKGIEVVENCGLPCTVLPTGYGRKYIIDRRTRSAFDALARRQEPEVVHAFDLHALTLGSYYARRRRAKLVYTICGGPVPRIRIPDMRPIVVFSRELYEGLQARHGLGADRLFTNAARIHLQREVFPKPRLDLFRQAVGIPEAAPVILTISRIGRSKLPPLFHFIEAADQMGGVSDAVFLIVGASDDSVSLERLRTAIDQVNARHRRRVVFWTDLESAHAARLLPLATAAVGLGRTAFEAMALGIPALIVGTDGFAGVADGLSCDRLAETNFSGRDALLLDPREQSPASTAAAVQHLLAVPDHYRRVAEEGRRWVRENLDVERGAEFYEGLYRRSFEEFYSLPAAIDIFRLESRSLFFRLYHWIVPEGIKRRVTDSRRGKVSLSLADG